MPLRARFAQRTSKASTGTAESAAGWHEDAVVVVFLGVKRMEVAALPSNC